MKPLAVIGLLASMVAPLVASAQSGADLIAFTSIRSGDAHIYLQTGGVDRQVTQGAGVHTHAALSHDGRLAYVKSVGGVGKVHVTDVGGANGRRLTSSSRLESSPVWSPDGRFVAFYSGDVAAAGAELRIVEVATGQEKTLVADGLDKGPTAPNWAADSSRIVFLGANSKGRAQVFVVNRDGSGLVDLSSKYSDRSKANPQISPDGSRVVFGADARQRRPLLVAELATGKVTELTPEADAAFELARWSPDGRQLVVVRSGGPAAPDTRTDIFVMPAEGGELRNLTRHPGDDFDPHWAPDGRSVVFASLRTGTSMLFRVDLLNGQTQPVSRGHRSHDMDHVVRAAPQ